MTKTKTPSVHWGFWVVGGVALIWNLMGSANFGMQMSPQMLAQMPEDHRAFAAARPAWATVSFAVAVLAGSVGCLLLLLRRALAVPVFALSLIGVSLSLTHALLLAEARPAFSVAAFVLTAVMPLAVAVFLWLYARNRRAAGVLR